MEIIMSRNYCSCLNCKEIISTNNIGKHYDRCLIKGGKFTSRKFEIPLSLCCQYCQSLRKNSNSLRQHEIRCNKNSNKIHIKGNTKKDLNRVGSNQFTKAKRLGLPRPILSKESIIKSIETRRKNGTLNRTDIQKKRLSIAMKKAVENHPESYTSSNRGRAKQIIYDNIKFTGQWEVDFYKWAKSQKLNPSRPKNGFKYIWNGERTYFPDFYLSSLNVYVEVKGYETDRDRAKWNSFTQILCIVKKNEIKEIRNGCFSVDKLLKSCYN